MTRSNTCNALLVHPQFGPNSFWNYQATCKIVGAKYSAAPLGLITMAALLPKEWSVRLVNRNTEELCESDLAWADVVMTGGMMSQQFDTLQLIDLAHAHGKPVVVGGPDATCSPHVYGKADFLVLGEAEEIMGGFLAAWASGAANGTFTAEGYPDLTKSPVPRFDLLKLDQYMHVGVQFSRGCPFDCEFCNVIELNGRNPRTKTIEQVLRELDAIYALGYRGHVDFVDDNLIGNKKAAKPLLVALKSWLAAHAHPFEFTTEASINLADDDELLSLMRQAGFFAIFVGIETPDAATLLQANKKQNMRRSIVESIHKIHRAGIFVNAGFIIGFDTEAEGVAQAMIDCIEAANIPVCMVGLLYALPNTRLSRRLTAEGRLHAHSDLVEQGDADQCTSGLNFTPLRPRRDALDDYKRVLQSIYAPEAYFGRVRRAGRQLDCSGHKLRMPFKNIMRDLRAFLYMAWHMGVLDRHVRRQWWKTLLDCLWHNPAAVKVVVSFGALYLHFRPFSRLMIERLEGQIAELDAAQGGSARSVAL